MRVSNPFLLLGVLAELSASAAVPVRELLQENRLEQAATICRQVETMGSADRDGYLYCAWAFLRSGRVGPGRAMTERLRKTGGDTREADLLEAFASVIDKKYADAKSKFASLPQERSTPYGTRLAEAQAELYEAQGQADTAAFLWRQLYADNAQSGRANWGLGRYYAGKNDLPKAKDHLEKAARAWPRHVGSRYNLAIVHLQNNEFSDAAKWLAECYKLDRADPGVLEQMGVLFEKKGKLDEAVKYWQRAAALDKDAPIAREKLSKYAEQSVDSLFEKKDYEGAVARLNGMGKLLYKEPKLVLKRGIAQRLAGKFDLAAKDLNYYLKKEPKDSLAHRELGVCLLNKKSVAAAQKSFEQAIRLDPQDGRNYSWLGFLMEVKGDLPTARLAWKKAVQLTSDPDELEKASYRLSEVEKRLKDKGAGSAKEAKKKRAEQREREEDDPEAALENEDIFRQVPNRGQ